MRRSRALPTLLFALAASCAHEPPGAPDAGAPVDGGTPDGGLFDGGVDLDAGVDAGVDAGTGAGFCEPGSTLSCASLAAAWASGTATCRPSGNGYDVTACARAGDPARALTETVRPALRDERWSDARCNLGDEFVFQITFPPAPADGLPSNQWVLRLEGGGFCAFDSTSPYGGCGQRAIDLVSSASLPADRALREQNPGPADDFSGAIEVLGHYCSSDLWTGTATTAPDLTYKGTRRSWRYTGALNVEAMLEVLVQRYGLDDGLPLKVLWRGGSAGGFGTFNNTHRVVRHLPRAADEGRLLVFPGAAFLPLTWDEPDYPVLSVGSSLEAFGQLTTAWKSALTPSCVAARAPGDPVHPPHECLSGSVLYGLITAPKSEGGFDLPTLVWQNRQDQLYMSNVGLPLQSETNTPAERAARARWVETMNAAMGLTGMDASSRLKWLYAPSDPEVLRPDGSSEPNVHGALAYGGAPPSGPANSVSAVLSRFWRTMLGRGPGRGRLPGEVHTFDCNWVPDGDATGCD